jgi:succinate-semialdehyde dehydrogenase/glutarate-semialdehyde dehydrogenase
MRDCAESVKRLSLELGGNAAFLVFDDADIELAIEGVMASKFRNAGQTCVCANRILVQSGIHDRFVDRLAMAVKGLKVGDGQAQGVTIGPLINAAAVAKVEAHLEDALTKGAVLVATTSHARDPDRFVSPALLTGVTESMLIAREETFGPLAPIFRFETEAEAVRMANATPFGLAGYFYTQDMQRAWRVADRLECGMIGLNTGAISLEMAPFGGIKLSGFGREGGREGIAEYLQTKAFHWGGLRMDMPDEAR